MRGRTGIIGSQAVPLPFISWSNNSPGAYEIGLSKSYILTVSSNPSNVTYSVSSGSLPSGMTLDPSYGEIYGIPTTSGQSYSYTITATNGFVSTSFSETGTVTAFSASGGTESTSGGIKTHTFTGSGTFTVNSGLIPIEVLVAGGGGGGGGRHGGGGGAGGISRHTSYALLVKGNYTISVGGLGGVSNPDPAYERGPGSAGGASYVYHPSLGTIFYAYGGGGGWSYSGSAGNGGSGGGGAGMAYMTGGTGIQSSSGIVPSGGSRVGLNGGSGSSATEGGGGGGLSTAGAAGSTNGGSGGNGSSFGYIALGGGGGGGAQTTGGSGGTYGGGNGGSGGAAGSAATIYAGGGGGSRSNPATNQAGVGYQGIVIIRYAV